MLEVGRGTVLDLAEVLLELKYIFFGSVRQESRDVYDTGQCIGRANLND
jgi:hypothetical protein